MLQKSRSKTIAKFKYLMVVPLMFIMLTYVSCSDHSEEIGDTSDLAQYQYTLKKGEVSSAKNNPQIAKYEEFLKTHKDYVAWAYINYADEEISYSVHSKDEKVPENYRKMELNFDNGDGYSIFINLMPNSENRNKDGVPSSSIKERQMAEGEEIPFALIEQVPLFPGCEQLSTNEEQKKCMSSKIQEHIMKNFNSEVGKGLTGVNRVIVQFKIDKEGKIADVKARAASPELEKEGIRVVESLPQMTPGKQNGRDVNVMYSLPIVFQAK